MAYMKDVKTVDERVVPMAAKKAAQMVVMLAVEMAANTAAGWDVERVVM